MKNTYRLGCLLATICLGMGLSLQARAVINASLDRNEIGPGETVQLTLEHDGQTDTQPDLGPLKKDFQILGKSTGSSIQFINGKMNAQVQVQLTLAPKRIGKLHIPALQWDGQSSLFLPLTVDAQGAPQPGNGAAVHAATAHEFIVATLDQKQPYVQAAVSLTVKLYVDEPLYQANLDLQADNDVLVQQVGQDRQYSEMRNGRNYQVVERKYLLFPQRSGRIHLDGPVLTAQVQDTSNNDPFGNNPLFGNIFGNNPLAGMLNATRPIRLQGNPVALNVRARPAGTTGHDWLPAQEVKLQESWQPDSGPIHAGDPVTRHLHLVATGLTAAQLPDLSQLMPLPAGLRAYPDQAKLSNDTQGNSVVGTRDQDIALIAGSAGHYQLPPVRLFWWDTAQRVEKEIDLPARTLDVLPGAGGVAAAAAPPTPNPVAAEPPAAASALQQAAGAIPVNRWVWISLGLAGLWLVTLAAWWVSRRQRHVHTVTGAERPPIAPDTIAPKETVTGAPPTGAITANASTARKAFQQACRENHPQDARRNLLAWAAATWPANPPPGVKALSERLGDPSSTALLQQLDRACYTDGVWQGAPLLDALQTLAGTKHKAARSAEALSTLYP